MFTSRSGWMAGVALLSCASPLAFAPAHADDQIIRPYMSVRSVGMGGVVLTTGLYDENFFNNPARVTANPESKFTLIQLTPFDINSSTISLASSAASGASSNTLENQALGKNVYDRMQVVLPAYYLATTEDRRFAMALGLITSFQTDALLQPTYTANISAIMDVGPALTVGYQFLDDKSLSVGATGHLSYRAGIIPNVSLLNYLSGQSYTLSTLGGGGGMVNLDLGTTYRVTKLGDFDVNLAAAAQNILGGAYSIPLPGSTLTSLPPNQPTSFGGGVSFSRKEWGFLDETVLAMEVRDIGNNTDGSFYRLLHIGAEARWKSISLRAGLNQGYWTAGLGFNFHYFTMDFATYGEELGLNVGDMEDRRYTMNFGFHI